MIRHRNTTYALIAGLEDVLKNGQKLKVRGSEIHELRNHITVINKPLERCIITPERNNNIFATIAETMWVLAGRNDLEYLSHYLPRAADFSDNGRTWRAGYGPRLRNWYGTDQFKEVLRVFNSDIYTRRAVMAIFDPAVDFQDSKDIPCNNWLHWLVREGKLNLSIAIRSNDAVWGFSGINSFEWSVLQEVLAYWLGVQVGDATFYAGSFHVYQPHIARAKAMVEAFPGRTWYEIGGTSPRFATPFNDFGMLQKKWFAIEAALRVNARTVDYEIAHFPDPLFKQFLGMLQLYNGLLQKWDDAEIGYHLSLMDENDLTAGAYEYLSRKYPKTIRHSAGHTVVTRWLKSVKPARAGQRKIP